MSLLELDHVSLIDATDRRETLLLSSVCLTLDAGELVAVWGMRRCGRSTLLRLAAGIQRPDAGRVLFEGRELADSSALGNGISLCRNDFLGAESWGVMEEIIAAQMARGVPRPAAHTCALVALERADAGHCANRRLRELYGADALRARLAMALASEPRLLLVDDAISGVGPLERDDILLLLRSLADEGLAVLSTTEQSTGVSGADRALSLSEGSLHGATAPRLAQVIPLHTRASA